MGLGDVELSGMPMAFHEVIRSESKGLLSSPSDSQILDSDYLSLPSEPEGIQKWISTDECGACFGDSIFEGEEEGMENLLVVLNERQKHVAESLLGRKVSMDEFERNSNITDSVYDNDEDDNVKHFHAEDEDTQLGEVAKMPFSLANVLSRAKRDEPQKMICGSPGKGFVSKRARPIHSSVRRTKLIAKENKTRVPTRNNEKLIGNKGSNPNNIADNKCIHNSDHMVPKRRPFSEISNVSPLQNLEKTGTWKCPRKRSTDHKPLMKQLGLEQWVRRVGAKTM